MALNSIELCSSALIKLGADGISSFEDGTAEARVASRLYPLAPGCHARRPSLVVRHQAGRARPAGRRSRRRFRTRLSAADRLPQGSVGRRATARGRGLRLSDRQPATAYRRRTIVLTYIFRPSEGDFPAYFASALVTRLAAEFCLPLTENSTPRRAADSLWPRRSYGSPSWSTASRTRRPGSRTSR